MEKIFNNNKFTFFFYSLFKTELILPTTFLDVIGKFLTAGKISSADFFFVKFIFVLRFIKLFLVDSSILSYWPKSSSLICICFLAED